ncbi:MAG: hypothetical protein CVV17_00180 [Gammaproteobacteria bacterium HGW-Gammaproteobacteria-7]|nr:MAG: hypothetical protein CVV17_00180 [Gammaproteobacteria bacterium HGW-Gammaproteobacteria-7]
MKRWSWLMLTLLPLTGWAGPEQFATVWPIETGGQRGAFRVVIDEAVYAEAQRSDLSDIAAFNGAGAALPMARLNAAVPMPAQWLPVAWLSFPVRDDGTADEDLTLRLRRDAGGALRELELGNRAALRPAANHDLLIDLGDQPPWVSALQLDMGDDHGPVSLRVDVSASDDLSNWRTLSAGLALVSLTENGLRVERRRLAVGSTGQRYLRLHLAGGERWPALISIAREQAPQVAPLAPERRLTLTALGAASAPGEFVYRSLGPIPVHRLDVRLASANSAARLFIDVRDDAQADWRQLAAVTAFRLGEGDAELGNAGIDLAMIRDRHWRIRSQPALAQAPELTAAFVPDVFVVLTEGEPPYRLAAGSAQARRAEYPLDAVLAGVREQTQADWLPPEARLGPSQASAGAAALRPDPWPRWRQGLLWAVLVLGAVLVARQALRVLRQPPPTDDKGR